MSGHHVKIERWRRDQRLRLTQMLRPDLLEQVRLGGQLSARDCQALAASADQTPKADPAKFSKAGL